MIPPDVPSRRQVLTGGAVLLASGVGCAIAERTGIFDSSGNSPVFEGSVDGSERVIEVRLITTSDVFARIGKDPSVDERIRLARERVSDLLASTNRQFLRETGQVFRFKISEPQDLRVIAIKPTASDLKVDSDSGRPKYRMSGHKVKDHIEGALKASKTTPASAVLGYLIELANVPHGVADGHWGGRGDGWACVNIATPFVNDPDGTFDAYWQSGKNDWPERGFSYGGHRVTIHELLHTMGVGHLRERLDVMWGASGFVFQTQYLSTKYYGSGWVGHSGVDARTSPYIEVAGSHRAVAAIRNEARRLRSLGIDPGGLKTGVAPACPFSEPVTPNTPLIQKWEHMAVGWTQGRVYAVWGALHEEWSRQGAEKKIGVPTGLPKLNAGRVEQTFTGGKLSVEASRQPLSLALRSARLGL